MTTNMHTATTANLSAEDVVAQLAKVEGSARARTLWTSELRDAVEAAHWARDYARKFGLPEAGVELDGGAVPNSYAYTAETTRFTARWDERKGVWTWRLERARARKKARGGDGLLRISAGPWRDAKDAEALGYEGTERTKLRGDYAWTVRS